MVVEPLMRIININIMIFLQRFHSSFKSLRQRRRVYMQLPFSIELLKCISIPWCRATTMIHPPWPNHDVVNEGLCPQRKVRWSIDVGTRREGFKRVSSNWSGSPAPKLRGSVSLRGPIMKKLSIQFWKRTCAKYEVPITYMSLIALLLIL